MRLAFTVHDFSPAFGHGRYVYELAKRLRSEHEVHVFANTSSVELDAVRVHRVPAFRANALTTVCSFPLPATFLAGRGFDVVHAQGLSTLRFDVVTAHITNAAWFEAQREIDPERSWRQRVFARVVTPLEHALYRGASRAWVIAISEQVKRELASWYGRTERVVVVPHGVDLDRFTPALRAEHRPRLRRALGLPEDAVAALFVGDLRKGADAAIAALARTMGPELVLVSRSDPARWRRQAAALGLERRVHFLPPTDRIEEVYALADTFLFPTPYDAFGMVIAEAMASGLPVVTTRRAGAAELIEDGRNGVLVDDPRDAAALGAELQRLASSLPLRTTLGEAARRSLAGRSWDAVAAETAGVYERIVAERRARA
jgi:UDP-glucose:(heptosyl)LPS alpha-1,3-glucosyltransferase